MTKEKKVVEAKQEVDRSREDKQMVATPEKVAYFQGESGSVVTPFPSKNDFDKMVPEMLSQADFSALEIAKLNRKVALKEAEKALAQNESADMSFKYVILQLYMKYKLDVTGDAISDDGKIMRGALLNQVK